MVGRGLERLGETGCGWVRAGGRGRAGSGVESSGWVSWGKAVVVLSVTLGFGVSGSGLAVAEGRGKLREVEFRRVRAGCG